MTVPYSFSLNQSVQLAIYGPAFRELRLRARVVHQTPLDEEGAKLQLVRIGLAFEHPTEDLQEMVQGMLQTMASREALATRQWKKG